MCHSSDLPTRSCNFRSAWSHHHSTLPRSSLSGVLSISTHLYRQGISFFGIFFLLLYPRPWCRRASLSCSQHWSIGHARIQSIEGEGGSKFDPLQQNKLEDDTNFFESIFGTAKCIHSNDILFHRDQNQMVTRQRDNGRHLRACPFSLSTTARSLSVDWIATLTREREIPSLLKPPQDYIRQRPSKQKYKTTQQQKIGV